MCGFGILLNFGALPILEIKKCGFTMINDLSSRSVEKEDFEHISKFPQNDMELFFMFPKADFPLTVTQLENAVNNRYDSTVVLKDKIVVGFANFYEVTINEHCSIGNVIINPDFRGIGIGSYLIKTMESIAVTKYNVKEIHISCFNKNVDGLLLYSKLGYKPYDIEKWTYKQSSPEALIKMRKTI